MASMRHYTDKSGHNGIRSSRTWLFRASKPRKHPHGAYFTSLPEHTPNLAIKLRIPREKLHYAFEFVDAGDLQPLEGARGQFIFYSPMDYEVPCERQIQSGSTAFTQRGGER